jgi:hypothetical protein
MNPRHTLAEAKIQLRQAKDDYQTRKAICECQALLAGGKNKEERDANAAAALRADPADAEALDTLREAEAAVDRAEAEVATMEDERKQRRLLADERHTTALERLAAAWEQLGGLPLVQAHGRRVAAEQDTTEWAGR